MGTAFVLSILLLVSGLIIRGLVRNKKAGKNGFCGGDCAHCAGSCAMHTTAESPPPMPQAENTQRTKQQP